jgi:hypothetical protein
MPRMLSSSNDWSSDVDAGEAKAQFVARSDAFLEDLRRSGTHMPKNLSLKEGAPVVFTPEAKGSGCSSSAGWRVVDE